MFPILKVSVKEKRAIYSMEEWVDKGGLERAWRILLVKARNPKEALMELLQEEVVGELYRQVPMAINHPGRLYVSRQEVHEDSLTAWVGYRDPEQYGPVAVHCAGIGRALRDAKRGIAPLDAMKDLVERSEVQLAAPVRPARSEEYRLTRTAVLHGLYERRAECEQAVIELLALQHFDWQIGDLPVGARIVFETVLEKEWRVRVSAEGLDQAEPQRVAEVQLSLPRIKVS